MILEASCRKRMIVSGRVQGVGFRFYTCRLAESYKVTGCVRNLPGGDVEIVAEGEKETVDSFLAKVAQGPGFALILSVKSFLEEPQGNYSGFGIKY